MNGRGGGYHCIFNQAIRLSMHKAGPETENSRIHAQDVVRSGDLLEPGFNLRCLVLILLTSDLDTRLNLTNSDGREV